MYGCLSGSSIPLLEKFQLCLQSVIMRVLSWLSLEVVDLKIISFRWGLYFITQLELPDILRIAKSRSFLGTGCRILRLAGDRKSDILGTVVLDARLIVLDRIIHKAVENFNKSKFIIRTALTHYRNSMYE